MEYYPAVKLREFRSTPLSSPLSPYYFKAATTTTTTSPATYSVHMVPTSTRLLLLQREGRCETTSKSQRRLPSMEHSGAYMLPPQLPCHRGKLTVVLDLDETLVFARCSQSVRRPYVAQLLDFLHAYCETVVWTASSKEYAQRSIQLIDPKRVIQHCIYRTDQWFDGTMGCKKDLHKLGRDINRTLLVENTPECVRGHEACAVLVRTFRGELNTDRSLLTLMMLLQKLVFSGLTVPACLAQTLRRKMVRTTAGDSPFVYCVDE